MQEIAEVLNRSGQCVGILLICRQSTVVNLLSKTTWYWGLTSPGVGLYTKEILDA
jgi:hypothetical protein